jgi:methionyl-tRNA formyltransferase
MPRVLFFGNSEGAFSNRHFAALLASRCEVVGVVDVPPARRASTNRPAAGGGPRSFLAAARERGLPVFEPLHPNREDFISEAARLAPDLILAVGYLNRLGERLLALPRVMAANFHASLLPAYRGKHPVFWALRNGEKWCGMTVHVMDAGLDTGDIIFQVRVRTRRDDSVGSLYDRIMDRSEPLVARLVECAARGKVPRRPQTEAGASYFSSVGEEDFHLDWGVPAETLRRWISASPGQCWVPVAGGRLFAIGARLARAGGSPRAAGTLIRVEGGSCVVSTGRGALAIQRMRTTDGRELPAADALFALGLKPGATIHP